MGYADGLRAFISETVAWTSEEDGSGLRVGFPAGSIELNPTVLELVGPEIAMLHGFKDREWMVWRPGEDVFEALA